MPFEPLPGIYSNIDAQREYQTGNPTFANEFSKGVYRGFLGIGGGLVGTIEWLIPGKQKSLIRAKENIENTKDDYAAEYGNWQGWAGRVLGEALPYMGTTLATGGFGGTIGKGVAGIGKAGLTGQAAIGAGIAANTGKTIGTLFGAASVGFAVEGQNAYDDAIKSGATEDEANAERLIVGTVNAAIEAAQITKLLKFKQTGGLSLSSFIKNVRNGVWDLVAGDAKKFTGQVLRTALEEGLEEAAQEGVSISVPGFLRGDIKKKEDGSIDWGHVLNRVGGAFAGGAFAGGVLAGGGALVGASTEIGRPSDSDIDTTIKSIEAMDISKEQKDLWRAKLNELKQDIKKEEIEERATTGENIYKTVDNSVKNITEEQLDFDKKTGKLAFEGKDIILDTEASTSGLSRSNETQALNKEWDEFLINSVNSMDTSLREEQIRQVSQRRGEIAETAKDIIKNKTGDARAKFAAIRMVAAQELGIRFNPLQMDENKVSYYYQRLLTSPELSTYERLQAEEGLNSLFGTYKNSKGMAKLPQPNQIEQLEKVFGNDLAESLRKLRGENKKVSNKIIETLNFPRAILASFDVSASGRQGLLLLPIAPKQWIKAVGQGYKAWTSPEYADYIDIQIKTDIDYSKFKESKGFLSSVGSLSRGEEYFASKWAKIIPGIRASERAYTTTLNSLRFYTFKKITNQWKGSGRTQEDYTRLAQFINHATGRGDLKGLEDYAPFLNAAFFAPRLQMGRIQAIVDLFTSPSHKAEITQLQKSLETVEDVKERNDIQSRIDELGKDMNPLRKVIAKDLVTFFGTGMGVLLLLSQMKGVDVEDDPRSSDFGKIRFGNTRIDFWGGYSQIARFVAQLVTAETKGTDTSRVMPINRGGVVWRFLQTKMSPAAGLTTDLLRGETFLGKQLEITPEGISEQAFERLTPLFIQDVVDALRYQGFTSAAIVAPLAAHGIGAMTYPMRPSSQVSILKNRLSLETFGRSWDEIGDVAQNYLVETNPEIELIERKARSERENFDLVATRLEEQRKIMNGIIDKMPITIKKELNNLDVYIPGLSRYVNNNYYLNDSKYKEYQSKVVSYMKSYLSQIHTLGIWNDVPDTMKASLIEEIVVAIKKQAKDEILTSITSKDLQQLKQQ